MSDKRYPDINNDNDNRRISIEDDYLELLNNDDVYDISSDVFSESSNDVYIGKKTSSVTETAEDVYISKPRKPQPQDIYSHTQRANQPQQRPPQRTQPQSNNYNGQRPANGGYRQPYNPNTVNDKYNTQRVPRVPRNDEISDHDARRGKGAPESRKKSGKGKKFLAVLLVIIIAFGGFFFLTANSVVGKFTEGEEIQHIEDVDSLVSESHVRNILLIGCDKANGGTSRSDSIMICSVNKQTGRMTVVSILRDTHLDVPGHQESKVNAAYAWGGANLLVQTIEQNFGIKIDDYATVDFEMFTALVDGLGGIEVDVTEDEADYINNRHRYGKEQKPETVPSGENVHLTGYQALWYSRIRKLDSDFNRTERQRKVIAAIVEKAKGQINPVGIFGLISTAKDVAPFIETTLSVSDFWNLVFGLTACLTKSGADMDKLLVSAQLPFDDTWWYSSEWDGSSISIDLEVNRQMLYTLLYEDYEVSETETEEDAE
ncbi:MAG: LCP family protein [Clostridia bacterium]|nr:LCP family protein [Clostridia bacterium]